MESLGIPTNLPLVLATGIHTNLSSWQDFGAELANTGRDVWLIEITGGPGQDCDNCPDYTFDDLTDIYVPALLSKVLSDTGEDKLQFVGHSNGCRSVLSSLDKGSFDPAKVETFVGVACPGAFEGNSPGIFTFNSVGDELLDSFEGKHHLTGLEIGEKAEELCKDKFNIFSPMDKINCLIFSSKYKGTEKISYTLAADYYKMILNTTDEQPGKNIYLDNFKILYGTMGGWETILYGKSDGFVSELKDEIVNRS
jgi:hypothetical protein